METFEASYFWSLLLFCIQKIIIIISLGECVCVFSNFSSIWISSLKIKTQHEWDHIYIYDTCMKLLDLIKINQLNIIDYDSNEFFIIIIKIT